MSNAAVIQHTLWELERRWGPNVLTVLRDAPASTLRLPSGVAALDGLLAGGLAVGTQTAVCGVPSVGLTTLAHRFAAGAGAAGLVTVYLDADGTFDPDYAARCGVDLARLLVAHVPAGLHTALAADVLRLNLPVLVVLDAPGAPPPSPREAERLAHAVARSRGAVLTLTPHDQTPGADVGLHVARLDWLCVGERVTGYRVRATVAQSPDVPAGRAADFDLLIPDGTEGGR